METLKATISRKAVLDHLKATSTDWPELKSWFNGKGGTAEFSPLDVATRGSVDMCLWALRTMPPELDATARELSAAFALGPEGEDAQWELAEAYKSATKGCPLFQEGLATLTGWLEGTLPDGDARRMRMDLSKRAMLLKGGASDALQALLSAFAPNAWGGCGCAHFYALDAHAELLGKTAEGKKKAVARAIEYHTFLIGDLLG
jgi:hypothetical protein